MQSSIILISSLAAFLITLTSTPFVKKVSVKLGIVDQPGERKVHSETIARGGGIAIFLGFIGSLLIIDGELTSMVWFIVAAGIIFFAGLLDDKYNLSPYAKLALQSLAAVMVISSGVNIDMTRVIGGRLADFYWLSYPITFVWIVGITNAINIVDGLDGLAAGISAISAFSIAIVSFLSGETAIAALALSLGAACLGFLPHNFFGKIFMGDSGSMLLGFSLASLSVAASVKLAAAFSFLVPVMILLIPIFDTSFAILRRIKNKKRIFEGDRRHIHHRLLDMGLTPLQSVLVVYVYSVFFGALAIISAMTTNRVGYLLFVASIIFVIASGGILVYFHHKVKPPKK